MSSSLSFVSSIRSSALALTQMEIEAGRQGEVDDGLDRLPEVEDHSVRLGGHGPELTGVLG